MLNNSTTAKPTGKKKLDKLVWQTNKAQMKNNKWKPTPKQKTKHKRDVWNKPKSGKPSSLGCSFSNFTPPCGRPHKKQQRRKTNNFNRWWSSYIFIYLGYACWHLNDLFLLFSFFLDFYFYFIFCVKLHFFFVVFWSGQVVGQEIFLYNALEFCCMCGFRYLWACVLYVYFGLFRSTLLSIPPLLCCRWCCCFAFFFFVFFFSPHLYRLCVFFSLL